MRKSESTCCSVVSVDFHYKINSEGELSLEERQIKSAFDN